MHELTSREKEILIHFALTDEEIAKRTGYAVGTVKTYKQRVFYRLNAINRTMALFKAVKAGLIQIEEIITE